MPEFTPDDDITPNGGLVLGECKLARNPHARREVLAQALEYARALFEWHYDELERAVLKGQDVRASSLWDAVKDVMQCMRHPTLTCPERADLRQATALCHHPGLVAIDSCRPPRSAKARVLHVSTMTCCFNPARLSASNICSIRSSSEKTSASSSMIGTGCPRSQIIAPMASRTSTAICSCVPADRRSKFSALGPFLLIPAIENPSPSSISAAGNTSFKKGFRCRRSGAWSRSRCSV